LIGSGAGASKFVTAKGKRKCKRCGEAIEEGTQCVEVAVPGSLGHRTYCLECYGDILSETGKRLQKLKAELQKRF
jgi:hypothetical protein